MSKWKTWAHTVTHIHTHTDCHTHYHTYTLTHTHTIIHRHTVNKMCIFVQIVVFCCFFTFMKVKLFWFWIFYISSLIGLKTSFINYCLFVCEIWSFAPSKPRNLCVAAIFVWVKRANRIWRFVIVVTKPRIQTREILSDSRAPGI